MAPDRLQPRRDHRLRARQEVGVIVGIVLLHHLERRAQPVRDLPERYPILRQPRADRVPQGVRRHVRRPASCTVSRKARLMERIGAPAYSMTKSERALCGPSSAWPR